jgi:RNA 3'-terminal phosphate cyclase (ATP)
LALVVVDGSHGEGGGQVLRTALSLSAVLGEPVTIERIRAGRSKPGLQRQHLACVRAVAELTAGQVEGAEIGSQCVMLCPGRAAGGEYVFDVGAGAGSAMLVLQTVLPALTLAQTPSRVTLRGGTHNPWAPPFDYIQRVFLPAADRFGVRARIRLNRAGWYPKGGGEVVADVEPCSGLRGADWSERGALHRIEFLSVRSGLPSHVTARQCSTARERLADLGVAIETCETELPSIGPGTMSLAVVRSENAIAGFSALGERGKPSERVALEACEAVLGYVRSGTALDAHLADQVVLYAALAAGETTVTTERVTLHLLTNLWVLERFLGPRFEVSGEEGSPGRVLVRGAR